MNHFLFLDVDDVLNSDQFFDEHEAELVVTYPDESPRKFLDPDAVNRVNRIVNQAVPDLYVILSSTWRHEFSPNEFTEIIQDVGADFRVEKKIPGTQRRPPGLYSHGAAKTVFHDRGVYIERFLNHCQTETVESILILDNLPLEELEPFEDFVVQTEPEEGLQDRHIDKALEILDQSVPEELVNP